MIIVVPNPVRLTVASTAPANKVGVKIYDNGVYLDTDTNRVRFVGLYQNGVEVGHVNDNGNIILCNGIGVIQLHFLLGYTFSLRLAKNTLPNGDYVLVVSCTKDDESKNYEVPIRIELT